MNQKIKNLFLLLTFLLLALKSFAFSAPKTSYLNSLEPLQLQKFLVTPNDDNQPLIDAFNSAKQSIQVGIFGISSQEITEALIAAQKRGVKVTIICDKYCTASPKRLSITNKLREAGAEFYIASSGFSITHWKMFVIDQKLAFVSTMNFIARHEEMRDMGVFITNPSIVKEIVSVFNADVNNAKNQTALTPSLTQANLIWSPVNAEEKLVQLIDSADTTIEIWIENMGNKAIHSALANAVTRKVKVRVLTSLCGMGMTGESAYTNLRQLISKGIQVQGVPYPATKDIPYIHAKTINVDNHVVFLGSENFSNNSLLKSRELGLIFKDPQIQERMAELYEADWKASLPIPDVAPQSCNSLTPPSPKG